MDVPEQALDGIFSSISSLYMFGIRGEDKHTYLCISSTIIMPMQSIAMHTYVLAISY